MQKGSCERAGIVDPLKPCSLTGAVRTVYSLKGAIPLVHGSSGCMVPNWMFFSSEQSSRFQTEARILTTRFEERDIIYGGKAKLRDSLLKVDRMFKPQLIVVISSCVASITGEDMAAVAASLRDQLNAEVITVDAGGFVGDFLEGQYRCLKALIDGLVEEGREKVPDSVNIVGLTYNDYNWRADIEEIKRILGLLGINVISSLSISNSVDEIRNASSAQLNLILSDEIGFRIGEYMKHKYGIPYICHDQPLPYGIESTNEWVLRVAKEFGKEQEAERIIAQESKTAYEMLSWKMVGYDQLRWLAELPVGIFAEASKAIGIMKYITRELLMEPVLISLKSIGPNSMKQLDDLLQEEGLSPKVLQRPDLLEQAEVVEKAGIDMAFGSTLELDICQQAGVKAFVAFCSPVYHKVYVYERPFMGYRGALFLYEEILNERLKLYFTSTPYGHVWDISRYVDVPEGFNWKKML